MTARCLVCSSTRVRDADASLAAGAPDAVVARMLGVERNSVRRHRVNGHVAPPPSMLLPPAAPASAPPPASGAHATPAEMLRDIVRQLGSMDVTRMSPHAQVAHLDAYRRAVADLARATPPEQRATTVVEVGDVEGLDRFMAILFRRLEAHPELRAAIREDIEREGLWAEEET